MDWQDVLSIIIFLLLATISKKRKPAEDAEAPLGEDEPSFSNIDTVRKKIEALRRQRCGIPDKDVVTPQPPAQQRPIFSAYKHLPKEENIASMAVSEPISMPLAEKKPKEVLKSIDLSQKKPRLRDWVVGQVILGTPAYRRYGNFIHR